MSKILSMGEVARLVKAGGPYIGPKGGKYADPQHKVPWSEAHEKTSKCTQCKGVGHIISQQTDMQGGDSVTASVCRRCNPKGKVKLDPNKVKALGLPMPTAVAKPKAKPAPKKPKEAPAQPDPRQSTIFDAVARTEAKEQPKPKDPPKATKFKVGDPGIGPAHRLSPQQARNARNARRQERMRFSIPAGDLKKAAYKLHYRTTFAGMPISVENRKGSYRYWWDEHAQEKGKTKMLYPYGYIRRTEGTDGDHVDVYLGPKKDATHAYIIDQGKKGDWAKFDEQKVMLGFGSTEEAKQAYLAHYNDPRFFQSCQAVPIAVFADTVMHRSRHGKRVMSKAARGGKYLRRVPYTDGKGRKRYRYYYRQSAAARSVVAGEDVRLGKRMAKVLEVDVKTGNITIQFGKSAPRVVKPDEWAKMMERSYGRQYRRWASKRAKQAMNAVLRHVPREMLTELPGSTDAERLESLKERAPEVYKKLERSFRQAGMNVHDAKRVVSRVLERRGWRPDSRAVAIGSVLQAKNTATSIDQLIRTAENLSDGIVESTDVAAAIELRKEVTSAKLEATAKSAHREDMSLRAALKQATTRPQWGKSSSGGYQMNTAQGVAKIYKEGKTWKLSLGDRSIAFPGKASFDHAEGVLQEWGVLGPGGVDVRAAADVLAGALSSGNMQKLVMMLQGMPGLKLDAAEKSRETLLEVPSAAPVKTPQAYGSDTSLYVAEEGRPVAVKARYRLMESNTVIASHDPTNGSYAKRKDYPADVQERAYERDEAEQAKVTMNAVKLNPAFVVNTNPDAVNGPPMVTPDGITLGGNSRAMSMQKAYADHPEKAAAMKAYLREHAHEFGLRPEDVDAMKTPILVREVQPEGETHTKDEMRKLVRQMNESFTQAMDPRTMQVALGRKLADETMSTLATDMGEGETLNAFLGSSRAKSFLGRLRKDGVIDARNANQYLNAKTGRLNEDGKVMVSRILVGRIVGNADTLSNTQAKVINSVARVVPAMTRASSKGPKYDLGPALALALDARSRIAASGSIDMSGGVDDKTFQRAIGSLDDMFDPHPVRDDKLAQKVLEVLLKRPGTRQMPAVFDKYADLVSRESPEGQGGIFDDSRNALEILTMSLGDDEDLTTKKSLRFGVPASLLMKAHGHKYKSRKRVGDHYVYDYGLGYGRGKPKKKNPAQLDLFGAKPPEPKKKAAPKKAAPKKAAPKARKVTPKAAMLASLITSDMRGVMVKHGNLKLLKTELHELRHSDSGYSDNRKKELRAWIKEAKNGELKYLPTVAEAKKTIRAMREVKTDADVATLIKDGLPTVAGPNSELNITRANRAVLLGKDDEHSSQEEVTWARETLQGFESGTDTSGRAPSSVDPDTIASTHGLAAVRINPELPKDVQKHIAGMVSNAFDDLSEVLGEHKLAHGGLQIRVTSRDATFALGFDYGARYIRPGNTDPGRWDPDWTEGKAARLRHNETRPPQIQIDMETSEALAHEYGHALESAAIGMAATKGKWDPAVSGAHTKLLDAIKGSGMKARSVAHEAAGGRKDYWQSHPEMFARTFEQYVHKKMGDNGKKNTMLTHGHYDEKVFDGVYHSAAEFKTIEPLMRKFLAAASKAGVVHKAMRAFGVPRTR